MKVLIVATVQSHICQFHKPLAEMLHEHGCEVHAAAGNNLAEKNGLKLDFVEKVFDVPFDRSPVSPRNIRAYREIKKIIDTGNYDVIHCNTPVGGIVTRLAAGKARRSGTKVFYTAHGFHFYNGASKKNWLIFYPIEKLFARMTDKLITINTEDYRLAKAKFPCPVYYIHGVGVDAERYHPATEEQKVAMRRDLGYPEDAKIILCVGELLSNKNQAMAIGAMEELVLDDNRYSNVQLLIAGNGPEKENLEAEIADMGMEDHIRLLGYRTDLERFQAAADMLVSCSYREGLPLNIIEAMLSGNPVVATDNRGHRDLVINGETGYLVQCEDEFAMRDRIEQLLQDAELRKAFAKKAYWHAMQYSFSGVKNELEDIYFE